MPSLISQLASLAERVYYKEQSMPQPIQHNRSSKLHSAPVLRAKSNVIPFDRGASARLPLDAGAERSAHATAAMRIVLVEWRIRKGQETEFLEYWSRHATVRDRSGLIGEFLSRVEDRNEYPWMIWELDERCTTFINVGLWREGADFQEQIGRFIDGSLPPMAFEFKRRRRVFVAPERWRMGGTVLPVSEHRHVN